MARVKTDPTRGVRVAEDLAEMLGWIAELDNPKDDSIADIVDPILRPKIERRFEPLRSRVETIKAARCRTVAIGSQTRTRSGSALVKRR